MRRLLHKYPHILWFLLFLPLGGMYFLSQHLGLQYHVIHTALDDRIPFCPLFIIPYILWYLYIPLPMLYMCFREPSVFRRQIATLFSGALLATVFFLLFPTCVDFRPEAAGDGVLLWLCRIIYRNDAPVNVLPSLHCYEATAIHLATFRSGWGRRHPWQRGGSALLLGLICLSTLFVKQHSVLDAATGCLLAAVLYAAVRLIEKRRRSRC